MPTQGDALGWYVIAPLGLNTFTTQVLGYSLPPSGLGMGSDDLRETELHLDAGPHCSMSESISRPTPFTLGAKKIWVASFMTRLLNRVVCTDWNIGATSAKPSIGEIQPIPYSVAADSLLGILRTGWGKTASWLDIKFAFHPTVAINQSTIHAGASLSRWLATSITHDSKRQYGEHPQPKLWCPQALPH